MNPFEDKYLFEMGSDLFTFPPRAGHKKYSRVQKQRKSNEMPEHSLCLNPEPPCVISVMTIYCDFPKNFILHGEIHIV